MSQHAEAFKAVRDALYFLGYRKHNRSDSEIAEEGFKAVADLEEYLGAERAAIDHAERSLRAIVNAPTAGKARLIAARTLVDLHEEPRPGR